MTRRLHLWISLALLTVAACEKSEETPGRSAELARPANQASGGPGFTKSSRPPRAERPAPGRSLRESLAEAERIVEVLSRNKALAEVAWNALELDPGLAREAFAQLTADSPERIPLIQHFAMRMADEDPDAALKWADGLGSEREIAVARAQIALVIADSDPMRAANLLSESGVASREFDVAIVQVLQRWAGQSPPEAAAWVAVFPPGGFRKAGVEAVLTKWTETDPSSAISWLSGLNDDEGIREEATQAMAAVWLKQEADVRETWLQAADARTREALEKAVADPK